MPHFLALLETVGNQRFIFATNRLREIVGASEIVARAGGPFALRAAAEIERDPDAAAAFSDMAEAATRKPGDLVDAMRASTAPRLNRGARLEAVVATSGKAVFRAACRKDAKALVAAVTERVARELPGLTVCGAVVDVSGDDARAADRAVAAVHRQALANRSRIPAAEGRFPGMPFLQPCDSSGLPARQIGRLAKSVCGPIADTVRVKRALRRQGARRMARLAIEDEAKQGRLSAQIQNLQDAGADWLGIVHADGNGFGKMFLRFGDLAGATTADGYFEAYRDFSLSLELCGVSAFRAALDEALDEAPRAGAIPVIPLVLGGDDLTVICDGRAALAFTDAYLRAFEAATVKERLLGRVSTIPAIAKAAVAIGLLEKPRLGAAAGAAITKPHHPFHLGYDLAEALLRSAKAVKRCIGPHASALDFHVLFDSVATSLTALRESWLTRRDDTTWRATVRPMLTSRDVDEVAHPWAAGRRFDDIDAQARSLIPSDDGDSMKGLPKSQQHALRAAILRSPEAGEAQFGLMRHRYAQAVNWAEVLGCDPLSLYSGTGTTRQCRILDMMEMNDLRQPTATAAP